MAPKNALRVSKGYSHYEPTITASKMRLWLILQDLLIAFLGSELLAGEYLMSTGVLEVTKQAFNEFIPFKLQSQESSNIGNNILNMSKGL